jgi:NAD(P)H dehydrogenase (quinone)
VGAGIPEPFATLLASFQTGIARGTLGIATSAVEELTGRAPTSVRAFVAANKAAISKA